MTNPNDPAYPEHGNVGDPRNDGFVHIPGMTIRMDLARSAMVGILGSHQIVLPEDREKLAIACFLYADAMIAQSNKEPK